MIQFSESNLKTAITTRSAHSHHVIATENDILDCCRLLCRHDRRRSCRFCCRLRERSSGLRRQLRRVPRRRQQRHPEREGTWDGAIKNSALDMPNVLSWPCDDQTTISCASSRMSNTPRITNFLQRSPFLFALLQSSIALS